MDETTPMVPIGDPGLRKSVTNLTMLINKGKFQDHRTLFQVKHPGYVSDKSNNFNAVFAPDFCKAS